MNKKSHFTFRIKDGKLHCTNPQTAEEKEAVLTWARPITAWGREIAVRDKDGKEITMIHNLEELDPESQKIVKSTLDERYNVAEIRIVSQTHVHLGNRYWHVETNRGPVTFLLEDPNRNIIPFGNDGLLIRDSVGNRFRISSFASLDAHSQNEINRIF